MATTRLIPMHVSSKKTIGQVVEDALDYGTNPNKTEDCKYVSSYSCAVQTAAQEFMLTKEAYKNNTGRTETKKGSVLLWQIRQSFKPNEITPEEANRLGYELAKRWTKGNHQFVVATHVDKEHIHNHIIFNSVNINADKKFSDFGFSAIALQRLSDTICLQNGYSIIENPKRSSRNYGKWLGDKKPKNDTEKLKECIDVALSKRPKNFDEFLKLVEEMGYEVKRENRKYVAFRLKSKQKSRFRRLRNLEGYTEEDIQKKISEIQQSVSNETKSDTRTEQKEKSSQSKNNETKEKSFELLIDIQEKLQQGKGKGYEIWAKKFNLKQMAQTFLYVQSQNMNTYEDLQSRYDSVKNTYHATAEKIRETENEIKEKTNLKNAIIDYIKTKDVYNEYKRSRYNEKFYEEHESELIIYQAAKKSFDKYFELHPPENDKKVLPGVKKLLYSTLYGIYSYPFRQNKKVSA